jgi:hypothetical protein
MLGLAAFTGPPALAKSVPSTPSAATADGARRVITYRYARTVIERRAETVALEQGFDTWNVFNCQRTNERRVWCMVSYYQYRPDQPTDLAITDAIAVAIHRKQPMLSDGYATYPLTISATKP